MVHVIPRHWFNLGVYVYNPPLGRQETTYIKAVDALISQARSQVISYNIFTLQITISYYIHYKVWDENTYPFPNFGNGSVISSHA